MVHLPPALSQSDAMFCAYGFSDEEYHLQSNLLSMDRLSTYKGTRLGFRV